MKRYLTAHHRLILKKIARRARKTSTWLFASSLLALDEGHSIKEITSVLQISRAYLRKIQLVYMIRCTLSLKSAFNIHKRHS